MTQDQPTDDAYAHLSACHDLALDVATMATFELDLGTGAVTASENLAEVLAHSTDPTAELAGLLAPIAVSPPGAWDDFELEQRTSSGQIVVVRARPAHHGDTRNIIGAIVDVTDRRRTEQAMEDLIDRYRLLLELSPDGIVVHEAGIVRYANSAAARFAHADGVDDLVNRSILELVDPADVGDTLERIMSLTEPGMATEPAEANLVALDGTVARYESVSVLTTWEGRPAYQVILRDLTDRKTAEAALHAQADLVAAIPDAIISTDATFRITSWNPAATRIYGWSEAEAVGRNAGDLLWQDQDREQRFQRTVTESGAWVGETAHCRKGGGTVEVQASVKLLHDEDGALSGVVAICSDITERKAAEAAQREAEQRFSTVVASLDEGILVVGADEVIQAANAAAARILGVPVTDLEGAVLSGPQMRVAIVDDHGDPASIDSWSALGAIRAGRGTSNVSVGIVRPDESRRWLTVNAQPLGSDEAGGFAAVLSFKDVTEQRMIARDLAWAANHDQLTGLPNRERLIAALDEALGGEPPTQVAVLFCDLDRFKEINDSLGHEAGDVALVEVTRRLRAGVRDTDLVARHGGDEFVVLCTGMDADEVVATAHRLTEVVSPPITLVADGVTHQVSVGTTVGVAFGSPGDVSADLLRDADVAMYDAKGQGRGSVSVFDTAMRLRTQRRLSTREDLRTAIETGALEVFYQPICRTRDGAVKGFEALVRWHHPTHGWLAPDEFIPLAEESGLVVALGAWVLETAATQAAAWRASGQHVYVSVNLSARQLSDVSLVPTVVETLDRSGLDPSGLWLELTESALARDADAAGAVLEQLRDIGVRVAIDDFGTGYSSLARLATFPVAALKIDRSFVAALGDGDGDDAIVETIVTLAHQLGLFVVAEGVETVEQFRILDLLGCDSTQGYLLGRPVPVPDVVFAVPEQVRARLTTGA